MIQVFKKDNINLTTKKVGDEILFRIEDVALALEITKTDKKDGKEYVRPHMQNIKTWLEPFGLEKQIKKTDYITKRQLLVIVAKIQSSRKVHFMELLKENSLIEETICIQSRFELSFKETLEEVLRAMEIDAEFQKPMFGGEYRIDFYIPQYNLAVEYDEEHHKWQKEEDITREEKIKAELNCRFIRLDYRNSDAYNAGLVAREIMRGE